MPNRTRHIRPCVSKHCGFRVGRVHWRSFAILRMIPPAVPLEIKMVRWGQYATYVLNAQVQDLFAIFGFGLGLPLLFCQTIVVGV